MKKIRILLADDHPLIRSGMRNLLAKIKDIEVVGEAGDGDETIKKVSELSPDVLVIDVSMPKRSGIEVTRIIRKNNPSIRIVVLTVHDNEEYVYQILKSGADGYVLKDAGKDQLIEAIRTVAKGERFLSPRVSEIVVGGYVDRAERREKTEVGGAGALTEREKEVLTLIAEGLSNQEIAYQLFLSPKTIDSHRTNLMKKLNIHDVALLVRYAVLHGFVKPQKPPP